MKQPLTAILACLIVLWPIASEAQRPRVPTVGVLVLGEPSPTAFRKSFDQGLRDLGYVEGKTIQIEYRSAERDTKRLVDLAVELARIKVDLIVAYGTQAVVAAKRATQDIPIVMGPAGAPVESGIVASLAKPGGNVTGLSSTVAEVAGKNLELIRELLPSARRVAALANTADPFTKAYLQQVEAAARALAFETRVFLIQSAEELDPVFETIVKEGSDAVLIPALSPRRPAGELALKHKIPAVIVGRLFPSDVALMSYGPNPQELFYKAAGYVDRILKGAKPADLPVQQPTKFELAFNLKVAKALGLTIPQTLLDRADEVYE